MSTEAEPSKPRKFIDAVTVVRVIQDASHYRWDRLNVRASLVCLPIIAGWIFVGILWGHQRWVVYSVAGAVSASFGAFQKLGESRAKAMTILLVGIAVFTWLGNVSGSFGWYGWVGLATLCGFCFGAMTILGYGPWWLGLQWIIAMLVYGSHSFAPKDASMNAVAIVVGGSSQLFFLGATGRLTQTWFHPQDQPPLNASGPIFPALLRNSSPRSAGGQYAIRVAIAMAASTLIAHLWGMPNGYWAPMTAAILMKPDFHEATLRGINRLIGTIMGAGLMTIVVAVARPESAVLGVLLLLSIFGCLALMRVNYAIFVACITAYVVLLFSTMGLPAPIVALHRAEGTLIGAGLALVVSLLPVGSRDDMNQESAPQASDSRLQFVPENHGK